ncbi:hypothetical protein EVB78_099 [Rhizobium phage RHph_N1_15]|nr:hypothetical protein EVB77_099 [Rhizobium phage RHph_N1_10]QIG69301.1 hypothetical protein EVB78_099 [Rhizobium phage RHph_N1_15]QIG75161.1 hypothetical protein EVC15_099 [Rhizobium phage RHph_N2_6]
MQMITRKIGSQRASAPKPVEIEQIWCGQGGSQDLILKTEEGWITLKPESEAETRQLMSAAACIFRNYRDKEARQ